VNFYERYPENGVVSHLQYSQNPSGRCTVLVSADGERTLCTFLGAACELEASDLQLEMFKTYNIFTLKVIWFKIMI